MKLKIRTKLIAGAIAALLAGPVSAAGDPRGEGADAPAGQIGGDNPGAAQPKSEIPRTAAPDYEGTTTRGSVGDNPLYERSADELAGVKVVDRVGDTVGDITRIVLAPDRESVHAVISVGGIFGLGAREIMISLDDLTPIDDKLHMNATKEEVTAVDDEVPDANEYVELKGRTPINESVIASPTFDTGKEDVKPGATSTTPKVDADTPTTDPETPRASQ